MEFQPTSRALFGPGVWESLVWSCKDALWYILKNRTTKDKVLLTTMPDHQLDHDLVTESNLRTRRQGLNEYSIVYYFDVVITCATEWIATCKKSDDLVSSLRPTANTFGENVSVTKPKLCCVWNS
jgi:hypothetical protein